jgi:uncharacterized protein YjcR
MKPSEYTEAKGERARKLHAKGKTNTSIATVLNLSPSTLSGWIRKHKLWEVGSPRQAASAMKAAKATKETKVAKKSAK